MIVHCYFWLPDGKSFNIPMLFYDYYFSIILIKRLNHIKPLYICNVSKAVVTTHTLMVYATHSYIPIYSKIGDALLLLYSHCHIYWQLPGWNIYEYLNLNSVFRSCLWMTSRIEPTHAPSYPTSMRYPARGKLFKVAYATIRGVGGVGLHSHDYKIP